MKNLNELARRYCALESTDNSEFRRKARVLQSLWRCEQGLEMGEHVGPKGKRPLGSRLAMPGAEEHLWSFLSDNIKAAVRREVLDSDRSAGKLFARPRIFEDLLSSQPLCFNLFAELQCDLDLATRVFHGLTSGRIAHVKAIEFEHSPGRGDPRYTGDRSAFDVFVGYDNGKGGRGFAGIEVKYHENLQGEPAPHRDRYDEIAAQMGCFRADRTPQLRAKPLQQIWRDHLLAGALLLADGYDDGFFVFLYPKDNPHCREAVRAYEACLARTESFSELTLETVASEIQKTTRASWIERFVDRYLRFDKVDAALNDEAGSR